MKRIQACDRLVSNLQKIHSENGYSFSPNVYYWRDYNTEFKTDAIILRDLEEEYTESNLDYSCTLHLEIEARIFTNSDEAGTVGNLSLQSICNALKEDITLGISTGKLKLIASEKDIQTEAKTVVSTLLKIDFTYKIKGFEL